MEGAGALLGTRTGETGDWTRSWQRGSVQLPIENHQQGWLCRSSSLR